ncbi:MAG: hypothetical protein JW871_07390 [Endomicrobiales bacterium]|nr:hypothetical protein [Endomicrobiales bacterium]
MEMKIFNNMRDCVKNAYENGCERGYEFQKMRHGLIAELKRLGLSPSQIKDELLEWNKRCEKPLNPSEQRSQLLKYVDWFEKKDSKMGCNALNDFCIGKDKCIFYIKRANKNSKQISVLPFDLQELEKFLVIRFQSKGKAMFYIVQSLRKAQFDKNAGEIIYIGFREIGSMLRDSYQCISEAAEIRRLVLLLVDEGIIEIVEKGQSGTFGMRKANGYRFLQWKHPERPIIT